MLDFYLGTHQPHWLRLLGIPLCISHSRMKDRKRLPRAVGPWALDSGGFSELSLFGAWRTSPKEYASAVRRYSDEVGRLRWASIQDWMCVPPVLARTGATVRKHQRRTVESYERLSELAPDLPWVPVLQGWTVEDYHRHLDLYADRGHDLRKLPLVGLGSLCRRQATREAEALIRDMAGQGLRLHAFGFKAQGLQRAGDALASADSMAWSFSARRCSPLPEGRHKNCANCPHYAMRWFERVKSRITGGL